MAKKSTAFLALGVSVLAHYGDPYKKQCLKDEQSVTINGLGGALCVPPCNADGSCPMDVPAGVTAKPGCVLTNSGTGQKYCALVCTPSSSSLPFVGDAQCGADASCKKGTSEGLCTYDDAPPPPSSQHWKPVISPSFSLLSEAIGVGFTKDGKTGYCGAGDNTRGPLILKTVDSGVTWDEVWPDNSTKEKFNLFLSTAVKSENEAIVTGVLFQAFTTDGGHFDGSKNEFVEPSQDAHVTPGGLYAIVIDGNKAAGVATSKTGASWTTHQLTANVTLYPPRYGSYPTDTTWYLTAGLFPTANVKGVDSPLKHLNHKVALNKKKGGYHWKLPDSMSLLDDMTLHANVMADPVPCSQDITNCFSAGIFKSIDGGNKWTQVYNDVTNNIYPNGIDCISADHCVAVVEGDSCRILVTTDGGKTWTEANVDTDPKCSLTYVAMLSETEAWVGGGHLSALDFEGRFWRTLDGGKSFTKEVVKGLYIFDLDMTSPTSGYAVGIDASGNGVELLKYAPDVSEVTV